MGKGVPHPWVSPATHTLTLPMVPRLDPHCPGATLPGTLAWSHLDTCPKRLPAPIHRPLEQGWPGVSMGLKDALFFLLFADIIYEGDWK